MQIMGTLHTYHSPAGKTFPVLKIKQPDGKTIHLAVGRMPLELKPQQLKLGVVIN